MKVLLIGFSPQSASVLNLLIERYYPNYQATVIDRCFGDNLRLTLPVLQPVHEKTNAMIIHLDGVGMIRFSPNYVQILQQFIGKRAVLFVGKGDLQAWQDAHILPDGLAFFIKSSYTKDDMVAALTKLSEAATTLDEHKVQFNEVSCNDLENTPPDGFDYKLGMATANQVAARQPSFLHELLDCCISIQKNALLHELLDVTLAKYPQKLTAGSQVFYIYGEKNLALVANLSRLIDYCQVTTNFQALNNVLAVEPISLEDFAKMEAQIGQNGYQKYTLNTLLWQMYTYILPKEIEVNNDELLLKMRYMPNFAQMQEVPEYIRALVSSCLIAPRSLKQLHQSMVGVAQISRHQLNRFFVLAILSGVADNAVLEASFMQVNRKVHQPPAVNAGVAKAQKTGFLQRLLGKLKHR